MRTPIEQKIAERILDQLFHRFKPMLVLMLAQVIESARKETETDHIMTWLHKDPDGGVDREGQ